jgi:hypothetical protein
MWSPNNFLILNAARARMGEHNVRKAAATLSLLAPMGSAMRTLRDAHSQTLSLA